MKLRLSVESRGVRESIAALQLDERQKLALVLQRVGIETIAYLRSLTTEMRPPARRFPGAPLGGMRRAHPGHWADVSSQLALAYSWEVEERGDEVVLALRNSAEHAVFVEARDGFFVLSGVADAGGPVEQALRKVIPEIAPGWVVRF